MRYSFMRRGEMVLAAVMLLAVGVAAQDSGPKPSYGLRAGFGLEPDQFVIGAQAELGRFAKVLRFAPSIDGGFGDNFTTVVFNADLRLDLLPLPKSEAVFYVDAGPTLLYIDHKDFDSDTEIGLSLATGLQLPMGGSNMYNIEARFGIGDIPDFRLLLGVYFGGDRNRSGVLESE